MKTNIIQNPAKVWNISVKSTNYECDPYGEECKTLMEKKSKKGMGRW